MPETFSVNFCVLKQSNFFVEIVSIFFDVVSSREVAPTVELFYKFLPHFKS